MKKIVTLLFSCILSLSIFAGNVEKVFTFSQYKIRQMGQHQSVTFEQTKLAGITGEPMLPYHEVAMMLPPGEKAISIEVTGEDLTPIPGTFDLFPQQSMRPLSKGPDGTFFKKEAVYRSVSDYPSIPTGHLISAYLNGFSFALTTFTPVIYNPAKKTVSFYKKMTVHITTGPDANTQQALKNLTCSENALQRVRLFAQNPEMMNEYPVKSALKTNYRLLIITPAQYVTGFQDLVNYYSSKGIASQSVTIETIESSMSGLDLQEKMRNYIISEYQANNIEQVLLGGDAELVPYRGLYCEALSGGSIYEDYNIPADIYYSSLDGNWNTNGDGKWGEPGEDDLLPELSVGRMSFSTLQEQANMVHKSVSYQGSPVPEEMKKPYVVSEWLYDPPLTWGSDYLELLIDDHSDNGYFTYGIPSAQNFITRMYDSPSFTWNTGQLFADLNAGKSFIHHCGHANSTYMMRLGITDITNQNFSQVNGIVHNYQLMYTHGCDDGAFDESDCIAERCTSISNFLVGGVFNSRYGWFDEGTTEGPSAHLHREFISAMYNPNSASAIKELGSAHTMSKIKTAPWVGLPGEFEPGAQRWVHYDCNVLGDPEMKVWTDNPAVGMPELTDAFAFTVTPNPCTDRIIISCSMAESTVFQAVLLSLTGQAVWKGEVNATGNESSSTSISLPLLDPGVYFLRLASKKGSGTQKVVITR